MTGRLRLFVTDGPDKGRTYELDDGDVTVGSHIDCDIVLADDSVSGKHAIVRLDDDRVVVRDLNSRNGTWYGPSGGMRLTGERALLIGESVRIARTTLRVETPPAPLDKRPARDGIDVHSDLPYEDARAAVLREFEHRYVVDILARHRGDTAAAARAAGLEVKHLLALGARPTRPTERD
ncbi:MAG: FHA domain-containing protein [Deltaproteobacteria bacterium]|nr:FHA domain-containing protein [Deltaproteobacteria bacterium]